MINLFMRTENSLPTWCICEKISFNPLSAVNPHIFYFGYNLDFFCIIFWVSR